MRAFSAGRALLLAGLFCFQSLTLYAELPPARSAAPAPIATPEVRQSDLQLLRDDQAAQAKAQSAKLEEQAQRLDRASAAIVELQAQLKAATTATQSLQGSLTGVDSNLAAMNRRLGALNESSAAREAQGASQATKLQAVSDDLAAMKIGQEGAAKQMREGLADIAALREDLKQRQGKLDSLTDLLSVIKKDVDANSEEIVEVKQSLKLYDQAPAKAADESGEWWDQALRWKYLPAVAVGLSAVAVGVAVSNR